MSPVTAHIQHSSITPTLTPERERERRRRMGCREIKSERGERERLREGVSGETVGKDKL